jgi:hypothetical protein
MIQTVRHGFCSSKKEVLMRLILSVGLMIFSIHSKAGQLCQMTMDGGTECSDSAAAVSVTQTSAPALVEEPSNLPQMSPERQAEAARSDCPAGYVNLARIGRGIGCSKVDSNPENSLNRNSQLVRGNRTQANRVSKCPTGYVDLAKIGRGVGCHKIDSNPENSLNRQPASMGRASRAVN